MVWSADSGAYCSIQLAAEVLAEDRSVVWVGRLVHFHAARALRTD
jgi:hypothetical protein